LRQRRRGRWQAALLGLLALLLVAAVGGLWWIDTPSGHRFLAGRIASMAPQSGLRITVGKIEGSIYTRPVLHDVRIADPQGVFARIPVLRLEWFPLAWLSNRLHIDRLHVPRASLYRLPRLRPSREAKPLLPDFDIRLADLQVGRLDLGKAVAGRPYSLWMRGRADIRSGRAIVALDAKAFDSADALRLALDSRPDANRFDLEALVVAPERGILTALSGVGQPFVGRITGNGDWHLWKGEALLSIAQRRPSRIDIVAQEGRYWLNGTVEADVFGKGGLARQLAAPRVAVSAEGTLANRLLEGKARLAGRGAVVEATGGLDLGRARFDNLVLRLRLLGRDLFLKNGKGEGLMFTLRLAGPFSSARFQYLLDARRLTLGKTRIEDLRAQGGGRLATSGTTVLPLNLTARRVVVNSPAVDDVLRNISIKGLAQLRDGILTSTPIAIRSAKLDGKVVVLADFKRGSANIGFAGDINGIEIANFGRVDLTSRIEAIKATGAGFQVTGRARALMRRLDNGFLRGLGQGLPQATSDLALGPDGRLRFERLSLTAPALRLNGQGYRATDGQFHFTASGVHKSYGPLRLALDGRIDRPKIDLRLASPMKALGLADVHAQLVPDAAGFAFTASGGSTLGPFTGNGAILLPKGETAQIQLERLAVGEAVASGTLVPAGGGLVGKLAVSGPAAGTIGFERVEGLQRIAVDLSLDRARFAGPPQLAIGRGQIRATVLLRPGATTLDATLEGRGLRYGGTRLGRFAGTAHIVEGTGTVTASLTSQRGRLFDVRARAAVSPGRISVDASGTIDNAPLRLSSAAILTAEDGGWRLAPTVLRYRGGALRLGGLLGGTSTHVDMAIDRMPLVVLDLLNSDLGLGGLASGTVAYDAPRGGVPSGAVQLRVRGLTRAGMALSSAPVDIGLNAQLTSNRAAMRAIVASGSTVVGRAQALMTPLGGGTLMNRLNAAPLRAQLRYNGNAETLWRLTGVELFTLSGNAALSADVGGTLADPSIRGSVATDNANLHSPVTGMNLTNLATRGTFDGSQLILSQLTARTRGNGSLNGTGRFTFSAERGIGIDIAAKLDRAVILDRDDIGATVTGPISVKSDGDGGLISGEFDVISSRFTLGRAAAVAAIPQIKVIEVNRRGQEIEAPRPVSPWRLAIKADARNRLNVTGLGMQSEWSADLDIGGTVTSPALTGTATLVRGDYDFAGKRFELRDGLLRFDGRTPIDPVLNITAEGDVSGLSATIRVTGTSAKPIIAFTSTPAMPQDELLSRLLFGTSITNLSAPEALQLASAISAFQGDGDGLDPINAVRRATGLSRLRILPADTATGQKASIAAGKNIGRDVYVELITDGQGYSATRVEYQITRWLSLLSSVSTIGRQSVNIRVTKDY
jgi:translocation and assembly module TamB